VTDNWGVVSGKVLSPTKKQICLYKALLRALQWANMAPLCILFTCSWFN